MGMCRCELRSSSSRTRTLVSAPLDSGNHELQLQLHVPVCWTTYAHNTMGFCIVCCAVPPCAVQVTVDGPSLITMPGTLAKQYKQLGGRVQLMGKPDPLIYTAAQELAGPGLRQDQQQQQAQQWLAIGDSLEHDVAG